MAIDLEKWDERIQRDFSFRIGKFDSRWLKNMHLLNNKEKGSLYGNLVKEFAGALRSKLVAQDFQIKVSTDEPGYSEGAEEAQIMANALSRAVDLKSALDDASIDALTCCTGWIEVGHTLDYNSWDPQLSNFFTGQHDEFSVNDMKPEYVEVSREEVEREVGVEIDNVIEFDPTMPAPSLDGGLQEEPIRAFDPEFGQPWARSIDPRLIVIPKKTKDPEKAEYYCKLVPMGVHELVSISGIPYDRLKGTIDFNVSKHTSVFQTMDDQESVEEKVVVAVVYVRWDRNDPSNNNTYFTYVFGQTDYMIAEGSNPYGGAIPLIPIKLERNKRAWDKSWVEDMEPYATQLHTVIKSVFGKVNQSLTRKWFASNAVTIDKAEEKKIDSPRYSGRINIEGNPDGIKEFDFSMLTQDQIAAVNLVTKLAQGEAGQSDLDRGVAIKKISARQTTALMQTSDLLINQFRIPVAKAASSVIMKVIHLLSLFNPPYSNVYEWGGKTVTIDPKTRDFVNSFKYKIDAQDMNGPASSEDQIVWTQLLKVITQVPGLLQQYDMRVLANETRRRFGVGSDLMNKPQDPAMLALSQGLDGGMPGVLPSEGGDRDLGDQGVSTESAQNAIASLGVG